MKYELTKDLETGNRIIDNEHRELLNAVNALLDACSAGKGRAQVSSTVNRGQEARGVPEQIIRS